MSRDLRKKEERMAEKDIHYYEPASGHGLKHDPFNAIVAPRPIAFTCPAMRWISAALRRSPITIPAAWDARSASVEARSVDRA
jgi:hypothetical protein